MIFLNIVKMKPLLFTFFAIILCYSLFFDNEPALPAVDELNYVYENTFPGMYLAKDTLDSYSCYPVNHDICFPGKEKVVRIPFGY